MDRLSIVRKILEILAFVSSNKNLTLENLLIYLLPDLLTINKSMHMTLIISDLQQNCLQ